jgi:hypothetical protein
MFPDGHLGFCALGSGSSGGTAAQAASRDSAHRADASAPRLSRIARPVNNPRLNLAQNYRYIERAARYRLASGQGRTFRRTKEAAARFGSRSGQSTMRSSRVSSGTSSSESLTRPRTETPA